MSQLNSKKFKFEAMTTDWIARHLWPKIRFAVRSSLSKRCRNCVISENYGPLNQSCLCEFCAKLENQPKRVTTSDAAHQDIWDEELDTILKQAAGKGDRYDALMLFSGGKDSTFMLKAMQERYPNVRLLLLLVDNGFLSPVALDNVELILEKFDVNFIKWKLKSSFVAKVFHTAFLHIKQQQAYSVVDLMDGQMTFDTARNLATEMNIPIILCGLGRIQIENVYDEVGFEMTENEEVNPIVSQLGLNLTDIFTAEEKNFWFDRNKHPTGRIPRFILPMVVWDPPESEIIRTVVDSGLMPKGQTSPLVTNNQIIPLIGIAEVNQLGFSTFEVEFAKNIRQGMSEREYWLNLFQMLEYSAKTGRFLGATVEQVLDRLGLSKQQLGIKA